MTDYAAAADGDDDGNGGGGEVCTEHLLWPRAGLRVYTDCLISAF